MARSRINAHDLMDSAEVAEAFEVTRSSLSVAMSNPDVFPGLAKRLPAPIRKISGSHVWRRSDVEKAVAS